MSFEAVGVDDSRAAHGAEAVERDLLRLRRLELVQQSDSERLFEIAGFLRDYGLLPERSTMSTLRRRSTTARGEVTEPGNRARKVSVPGRCAVDAVVAATALLQERPVVLLTSDPDDMSRLAEEPGLAKTERVAVQHV